MSSSLGFSVLVAGGYLVLAQAASAQNLAGEENADHAGIISHWDEQSLERGRRLFQIACAPCHGVDGVKTINPQARPFAVEKFQNGSDPFSMFKTVTRGYKNMPSQTWMTPAQRYDVIQYIRETFVKKLNPTQYFKVDQAYLDSLPRLDPGLARTMDANRRPCDFGPALESALGTNVADALTVRLQNDVTLSYDLHRMRLAGAWRGGFLDLSRTGFALQRGEGRPLPEGKPLPGVPEWSWAFDGRFDYPTNGLLPRGPLPERWMKYQGHYVYDRRVVLSYLIEGRQILECPDAETNADGVVVIHTLRIGAGSAPLRLCAGRLSSGRATSQSVKGQEAMATDGQEFVAAAATGETAGFTWETDDQSRLVLNIPAAKKSRVIRVLSLTENQASAFERFGEYVTVAERDPVTDPATLIHGGAPLWPMPIKESGALGRETGAYALDTVPVPFDNPYGAWMRTSAVAFFPDGRAVVTTYTGDVWIVSGLDHSLQNATWSRFASGLYEPFGAQVIDGLIYVTCHNGIVRLHDLNHDGEADFYETLYADTDVSTFFHSFNFDLQVDRQGNLYYAKAGEYTDYKLPGSVLEIAPDGSKAQVYCTGFRVPNGMGMLPDGRLTVSDNQGDWMPASKINIVRRGGFYGYVQNLTGGGAYGDHWSPDGGGIDPRAVKPPATFDQPIIWMPQEFDNSSSAQLWVNDQRFGPLSGRLLHCSFGKGWVYYLMTQDVGAASQASIVALPFQFDAGLMRLRLNPADGQLYAVGLSGWQGPEGGKDGCLQRLRYTGKPIKMLDDVKVHPNALSLKFNFPLDPVSAANPESYHLEQWNYLWSSAYGSDQYSVEHPGQKGHDKLNIASVHLSPDAREVELDIPGLHPVNQVELRLSLTAADGVLWKELAYLTINAIPDR
jgi:mono/diheme cytochrome c family protein